MNQARSGVKRLTERELQVLALIAREHMSNTEIAERLTIEESTVESHVHHILQKLGVHTRNEAARLYLRASEASMVSMDASCFGRGIRSQTPEPSPCASAMDPRQTERSDRLIEQLPPCARSNRDRAAAFQRCRPSCSPARVYPPPLDEAERTRDRSIDSPLVPGVGYHRRSVQQLRQYPL